LPLVDLCGALDRATASFASILGAVGPHDWDRPSVNPGWSVYDLVNHVVGGNRRYVLLLAGRLLEEVEAMRGITHLSDDPMRNFEQTSAEVIAAFHEPGALDRTVHHRQGDRSGQDLLAMRVMEHSLHGWDLARSIARDHEVDDDVAAAILTTVDADPGFLARCRFPAYRDPGPNAAPSYRLRQLTGRA
jgi:uncharacterized protein (TIGR03086 family)